MIRRDGILLSNEESNRQWANLAKNAHSDKTMVTVTSNAKLANEERKKGNQVIDYVSDQPIILEFEGQKFDLTDPLSNFISDSKKKAPPGSRAFTQYSKGLDLFLEDGINFEVVNVRDGLVAFKLYYRLYYEDRMLTGAWLATIIVF